jgi:four helix bundle protein
MSRDHTKLRVCADAHRLTLDIYRQTKDFPRDEWFGTRAQLRRAAVSIPTNIVEGNARKNDVTQALARQSDAVVRQLQCLVESMERELALERAQKSQDRRQKTADRRPSA